MLLALLAAVSASPQSSVIEVVPPTANAAAALLDPDGAGGVYGVRPSGTFVTRIESWQLGSPQGGQVERRVLVDELEMPPFISYIAAVSDDHERFALVRPLGLCASGRTWSRASGETILDTGSLMCAAPLAMTEDGAWLVGSTGGGFISSDFRAALWSFDGALTDLGSPFAGVSPLASAVDVTSDGQRVAVSARDGSGLLTAHLWDQGVGYTPIPAPTASTVEWWPTSITADGSIVALTAVDADGEEDGYLWNAATGSMRAVPPPPGFTNVTGEISRDGTSFFGEAFALLVSPRRVVRYTASTGTVVLDTQTAPGATVRLSASADGSAISVSDFTGPGQAHTVYRWESGDGSIGRSTSGLALPNSAGRTSEMTARGSSLASNGSLTLGAEGLPPNVFGIFVCSRETGSVQIGMGGVLLLGGSVGGGTIGRFNAPGQILSSGTEGRFELAVDTSQIPQGIAFETIAAGDTWYFQAWHRDVGVGVESNLSERYAISFY